MINKIGKYAIMAATMLVMTGCSQEDMPEPANASEEWQILVSDFPAFNEPNSRALGDYEAGKSEWIAGDKIMLKFDGKPTATLERQVGGWESDSVLKFTSSDMIVTAIYAPNYSLANGEITKTGEERDGMDEYIVVNAGIDKDSKTLSVDFSNAERTYSRLRLVGDAANKEYTVSITHFTPAGESGESTSYSKTLTTNENGNIFLYGSWTADAVMTIGNQELALNVVSVNNTAYVAEISKMATQESVTVN